jgi:hypothetical protein
MGTYDTKFDAADTPFAELDPDFENFKKQEIKYQLSAKALVARDLFGSKVSLYGAYTQEAWWQLFSDEGITSAPFRDINHEPEIFLRRFSGADLPFGGRLVNTDLALVHESNGRSQFLSRSWNRVMARFTLDYGDLALFGRLWYRLPEDDEDDDNPYEYRYLGYGDLRAVWAPNRNTFSLMVRPGTGRSGDGAHLELSDLEQAARLSPSGGMATAKASLPTISASIASGLALRLTTTSCATADEIRRRGQYMCGRVDACFAGMGTGGPPRGEKSGSVARHGAA